MGEGKITPPLPRLGLKGKSLINYTNILSPNEYKMNNKIILKYFQ